MLQEMDTRDRIRSASGVLAGKAGRRLRELLMNCPHCNHPIPKVICPKCGKDLTARTNQADAIAMHMRRCQAAHPKVTRWPPPTAN